MRNGIIHVLRQPTGHFIIIQFTVVSLTLFFAILYAVICGEMVEEDGGVHGLVWTGQGSKEGAEHGAK